MNAAWEAVHGEFVLKSTLQNQHLRNFSWHMDQSAVLACLCFCDICFIVIQTVVPISSHTRNPETASGLNLSTTLKC